MRTVDRHRSPQRASAEPSPQGSPTDRPTIVASDRDHDRMRNVREHRRSKGRPKAAFHFITGTLQKGNCAYPTAAAALFREAR